MFSAVRGEITLFWVERAALYLPPWRKLAACVRYGGNVMLRAASVSAEKHPSARKKGLASVWK